MILTENKLLKLYRIVDIIEVLFDTIVNKSQLDVSPMQILDTIIKGLY